MITMSQTYSAASTPEKAGFHFVLTNLGSKPLVNPVLNISSPVRLRDDATGGKLVKKDANTFWLQSEDDFTWQVGEIWALTVTGLSHLATNRGEGILEAHVLSGNESFPVHLDDLTPDKNMHLHTDAPAPEGAPPQVLCLPWPADMSVQAYGPAPTFRPEDATQVAAKRHIASVQALYDRLYPGESAIFSAQGKALRIAEDLGIRAEGYQLEFANDLVRLRYRDPNGLHNGLVTLTQLVHGARRGFQFPLSGVIADRPRYAWRSCHLDVSRHFIAAKDIKRFLDRMAWLKMNRFHWHLSDDEGWRIESKIFPELNEIASWRGPDEVLAGQYTHIDRRYGGYYTQQEIREIVSHAKHLGIEIMPEIDIPGHCYALLAAMPHLVDPDEPKDSYRSVQGYADNALNPAVAAVYDMLDAVFDEVIALFPFPIFHIGADEVAQSAWMASPLAQALMQKEGLKDTYALQAYFLNRIHRMLSEKGKVLGGWDECAYGGGVPPENTLLFAWQSREVVSDLIAKGYQTVATPGQCYYLDMRQGNAWDKTGASWAGTSSPEQTYAYEPGDAVLGVQAGIWCERINRTELFNYMVFPRLYAVAESGWTSSSAKEFRRFIACADYMPVM